MLVIMLSSLPLARSVVACTILGTFFVNGVARAQTTDAAPSASFDIEAVHVPTPPLIDGLIGEDEWAGAAMVTGFMQYEPRRGDRSEVRTDALVLHDAGRLYVAFRAWDTEPITAQLTQRDTDLLRDDAVMVVIDTTFDRRSGYYFITNALGTQADGRIADDGRSSESSWDAPWQSAARRTEYGWSAELSIPLSSVRYVAGENRTWGINFGRSRRRTLELSFWTGPLDSQWRVSQAGRLVSLTVPPPVDRIQMVPYGLTRMEDGATPHREAGIDGRYAVTPTTAVYGTLFPDFATIEADQEQVNLTRFEVSLREKRQFFLEGQEQFNQRFRTFYSRRVADITAGGKLLGKQGPWTMAFISAQGDVPGTDRGASYNVARAQRDVSSRSTIAIMGANRRLDGVDEGSVSADANLFFTRTFGMTAQVVKSYGRFGRGTEAFFLRPSYDSPTGHFHVRYGHLGDRVGDNLNAIGLMVDDDRREIDAVDGRPLAAGAPGARHGRTASAMSEPFLRLAGVTRRYGDRAAVDDLSLSVTLGDSVVILGPSGCGKTTVLRLIAGLERPDAGEVWLDGRAVARAGRNLVPPHERRLGFVFQDLALWPHLTVNENLRFVTESVGVPHAERAKRIREVLGLVRIETLAARYPHELSGGEQQRAALARALVGRPRLMLLDEPFSSLDPDLRVVLRGEVQRLQHSLRLTSIYVTHHREDATALADRIVEMHQGRIVAERQGTQRLGPGEDATGPRLRR